MSAVVVKMVSGVSHGGSGEMEMTGAAVGEGGRRVLLNSMARTALFKHLSLSSHRQSNQPI